MYGSESLYGTSMLYQLSLFVWERKIGPSCIVLVSVKVMVIQHIKHNFFSYSNAELELYNLRYKQYSCTMDLNYKYNIGYVMKTDKTC